MRILAISQFHQQRGRGGNPRIRELGRHWTDQGSDVVILASTVDHASGRIPQDYERAIVKIEEDAGARVMRVWTLGASKTTDSGRIMRDLSFAASATLGGVLHRERPDVVLASSPPLFVGLAGVALARFLDAPLVFEVRDLWPDFAVEAGHLKGLPARFAYGLERFLYRSAERIIVVTPGFRERLIRKGVTPERIRVVPNGADLTLFHPGTPSERLREALGWSGRFVALYAGIHGPSQGLDQVVRAAEILQRSSPTILVALLGNGSEKTRLEADARKRGLANLQFLPQVARADVPEYLRSCDVGLVPLRRMASFSEVYPGKVFDIMGCGKPVVFAGEGLTADLLAESGGGVTVPPESPLDLAAAVAGLAADHSAAARMGAAGAVYVAKNFDRRALAYEYLRELRNVARRKS